MDNTAVWQYIFGIAIFLTSLFLILLVLVQRGRGGGIAGALGGAGGQSAFGTKAGDLFTRITVGVATFWILLCCAAILVLKDRKFSTGVPSSQARSGAISSARDTAPVGTGSDPAVAPDTSSAVEPPENSGSADPSPAVTGDQSTTSQESAASDPSEAEEPEAEVNDFEPTDTETSDVEESTVEIESSEGIELDARDGEDAENAPE